MSDKSYGDHMSRGIVKNPLLSTAVTGLSIEDLTQNAVLLPVSRTQELFGRQEPETPVQFTPTPSGETFTPIHPPEQNASQKQDDFDVNEYFARLQGTRYVSAPINTHIEDANDINREENLEEINLNDASDNTEDIQLQQSITADIAQNFSQLPTVLPQVASAVFSSFSNMLSMKREPTPVRETHAHVPVQSGVRETDMPLVGVSEREITAPPREPPVISGPGNFRLTTKKKYAQIPGLSSGEPAQMPAYTPPAFNQPIFTPSQPEFKDNYINTETNIPTMDLGQTNVDFNVFSNIQNIPETRDRSIAFETTKQDTNFVATPQFQQNSNPQAIIPPPPMFSNLAKKDSLPNVGQTILPPSVARRIGSTKPTITSQAPAFATVGNIFVPAPVAGESLTANASQPSFMGQSNLSTSFPSSYTSHEVPVAPQSTAAAPANTVASTILTPNVSLASNLPQSSTPHMVSSINVATEDSSSITGDLRPPPMDAFVTPSVSKTMESITIGDLQQPPTNVFSTPPAMGLNTSTTSMTPNAQSVSVLPSPQLFTPASQPQPLAPPPIFPKSQAALNIPPPTNIPVFSNATSVASSSNSVPIQPHNSDAYLQNKPSSEHSGQSATTSPVAQIFNPNQHVSLLSKNSNVQLEQLLPRAAEPPKIPEPPKASGNTNFRMTKKRPQYYSGPIEGVGAISNNVKPILTPVAATAFEGAVFTPETNTGYQAAVFTPENITENVSSSQGAVLTPDNINEQQQQLINYTPVVSNSSNYPSAESVPPSYNFNTAFDFSRQAPVSYEPPKEESAFGIIGSLKSKLSSIDINKLQNSVTTFFDPGYNTVKTETTENQSIYGENQGIEIFVANPNVQEQPYNYEAHQYNFTYGQGSIPNASEYYNQQIHNVYSTNSYYSQPSYGTQSYSQSQIPVQNYNPNNPKSAFDTEIPQGVVNLWGSYDPNSTDYHKNSVIDNSKLAQEITHAVDNESSEITNVWGTDNPTSKDNDKDNSVNSDSVQRPRTRSAYDTSSFGSLECNVSDISYNTHEQTFDNGSSKAANVWGPYNPTSKDSDKDSASNIPILSTSSVNSDSIQRPSTRSAYDASSSGSLEYNVLDNSYNTHEQMFDNGSSKGANVWGPYDSPGTSDGKENVQDNSNITHETTRAVGTKIAQNASVWGSYASNSSNYDKNYEKEHETVNVDASIQGQLESNVAKTVEIHNTEIVAVAMKNLQIKEDGNVNIEEIGLKGEQNAAINDMSQPTFPYINDISSPSHDDNGELKKSAVFNYVDMLKNSDKPEVPNAYVAPLNDPFLKPQEISDGVSEGAVSWNSNEEEVDDQSAAERLLGLSNDDSEDENERTYESEQSENLDICETCREVNQPDHKDEDLTHKLIKNITAPIQLSNPVEVPLPETNITGTDPEEFDTVHQCAEILLIADETIETLQIQSATELLNENENTSIQSNYGWRAEVPLPPGEDLLDHDYTLKTNPDPIGYLPNNELFFDNAPKYDNIKTQLINISQKTPIVFQSQMSIPSAPPAEDSDDAKSDETGVLDVQSIEQDASKDFPVFEEFVIEPSETEDDKIELKHTKGVKDSFTNRVDRFKKLEETDEATEQPDLVNLPIPNTKMLSYLDTGNYAVETHFKNSRTSPSTAMIPPGFEEHYGFASKDLDQLCDIMKAPNTTTQTKPSTTVTSTGFSTMTQITNQPTESKLPDFSSVFGAKTELVVASSISSEKTLEPITEHTSVNPQANIEDKVQQNKPVPLQDPINFFASSAQGSGTTEGVNRLASYFAAPAETSTKSFFELSQGQDHYRQNEGAKGSKPFFELSQSQDHYKDSISDIPHDKYLANLNLMKDLTSCQNMDPNKEQIVRTVNYFTIEYDNDILNFNKGEPSLNLKKENLNIETKNIVNKEIDVEKEKTILNDETLINIVNKCEFCNDLANPVLTISEMNLDIERVRFRQAMDGASSPKKEEINIDPGRDNERSVNVKIEEVASDGDNSEDVALMTENRSSSEYEPVKHHWFYRVDCDDKSTWRGFSLTDSRAIENAFQSSTLSEGTLVPTDGGRYDVNVVGRLRIAVYWSDKPTNVRRCSWFYKGTTDARYVPYTEAVAEKLEVEYRHGITTGEWHRRLVLPNNELVVMHGPAVMVHFLQAGSTDAFSAPNLFTFGKRVYRNPPKFKVAVDEPANIDHLLLLVHGAGEWKCQRDKIQSTMRPRVVRRGIDESEIEDTEPSSIDHLLLLCHGVGSACDMRFRPVEEVVDDFRATSLQLLQSHYRNSFDNGIVGRVEVLPISWHASLHSGPRGVDRSLARVTLASIPRLRSFTNDTVLDVLLYTSPHYCQMILDTVCSELNRIYTLFMSRNPDFRGRVSLGGHSLGSVILYDLLCNQPIPRNPVKARIDKTYISGTAANNPIMQYPALCFEPLALYALGSPIAIFECIRGVEMLGGDFYLPTCRNFFNIFHPYDPIAYRIEPLVNQQLQDVKPSLIPHHKGRKRMHLELKDTMARVGADLKQKLVESIKNTWSSMWSSAAPPDHQLEKVVEEEIEKEQLEEDNSKEEPVQPDVTPGEMLGRLNNGRRIDYVLQEAPFEMINEYIFAMSSHVCYWESEDVMLLILREIYDSMGVQPDVTVPQQSMTVQRTTIVSAGERVVTADASTSRLT